MTINATECNCHKAGVLVTYAKHNEIYFIKILCSKD